MKRCLKMLGLCYMLVFSLSSDAHHVLGRPSYSLNEDSNTPPSMAVETQIGEYFVTYMIFPAFPKPNENGRINLYVTRIDNGAALDKKVTFSVRDNGWFADSANNEVIGTQDIDDGVYRQGFVFSEKGKYIIRAYFESGGEPYELDFPLQVGNASPIGPIGGTIAILIILMLVVNIVQRKRIARAKMQQGREAI